MSSLTRIRVRWFVLTAIAEIVTTVGRTKLMCSELVKAVELTLFLALLIAKFTPLVSRAGAVPPQERHPFGANAPSSAGARGLKSARPRARNGPRRCSDRDPLPRR